MKVLIVDDSRAMRLMISRGLRDLGVPGAPYLEAPDGDAALRTIRADLPDLVISDFNRPGMDGLQLLRAIRDEGIRTRFGFITSEASEQVRHEAAEAGALFVITKPFTQENLGGALCRVLVDLGCCAVRPAVAPPSRPPAPARPRFPKAASVVPLLKRLLSRDVVGLAAPRLPLPREGEFLAEYTHLNVSSYVVICNLSFAARVGAALTLIPRSAAAEAIVAGRLTESIADNFHEALSVMSRLFDAGGVARVHLGRVHLPGEAPPDEVVDLLGKPIARTDLAIDIGGYGPGSLTLAAIR
jgi:two-component system chemotaxis response regulator CheY